MTRSPLRLIVLVIILHPVPDDCPFLLYSEGNSAKQVLIHKNKSESLCVFV